jgi:hypothetical protein
MRDPPVTTSCSLRRTIQPVHISHSFLYARVLGAYHATVLYTGPGMRNHEPLPVRFDFLWVRWYELVNHASSLLFSSALQPSLTALWIVVFRNPTSCTNPRFLAGCATTRPGGVELHNIEVHCFQLEVPA